MKQLLIWSSEVDIDEEGWLEFVRDYEEANDVSLSDAEKYCFCRELNDDYLDFERDNLNIPLDGDILILADLGLWDGRRSAYKLTNRSNVRDILCSQCDGEIKFYCDGKDICADEYHHDGCNHYIYREIAKPDTIDNFLCKVLDGTYSRRSLNYYTKSLAPKVAEVYGFV